MFIDEKGKLFGKISIVDMLIVLIVLMAAAGVYYKASKSGLGPIQLKQDKLEITILTNSEARQSVVDCLNVGDAIYDWEKSNLIGRLVDKQVQPLRVHAVDAQGNWKYSEKPGLLSVLMTIEADGVVSDDSIRIDGKAYLAGHTLIVKSKATKFQGQIQSIRVKE